MIIVADRFLDFISKFNGKMAGITIFPFIFVRSENRNDAILLNHELIHIEQQKETLFFWFWIRYALEFIGGLIKYRDSKVAYYTISFEEEAFDNMYEMDYLDTRKKFAYRKYLNKVTSADKR